MKLSLQTFSTIVANSAATVQASSNRLLDLSSGSVLRAILEANASVALWIQWLLICVLRSTRASSSTGSDLDSWMADFGFSRLPASPSGGTVTFSRYSAASAAQISPGAIVKTSDGGQSFTIAVSTTSPAWDSVRSAYVIPAGTTSIDVPIQAQVAGTAGNVQARTINIIASPIVGVDTVFNALPTVSGTDGEGDAAFRSRFVLYINSRSRSTLLAIKNAISSVQQGLSFTIQENWDVTGAYRPGSFVITVDDGSGTPSSSLLTSVSQAVEAVRPIGSTFAVRAPTVKFVSVSLQLTLTSGANRSAISSGISKAITSYVNGLTVGASLPVTRTAQLAYDADPSITNVTQLQLNNQYADIPVDPLSVIKLAQISVT